jgi:hypothetical protein
MGIVFLGLLITALLALILRYLFRLRGKWLAVIVLGLWPPFLIVPLSIYYSLVKMGISENNGQTANGGPISMFVDDLNLSFIVAGVWFILGIIVCIAAMLLPRKP